MALNVLVNGPSLITIDGSSLGYTTPEGVTHDEDAKIHEVLSDLHGDQIPVAALNMGRDATVRFQLVLFDEAVLKTFIGKRGGGYGATGTYGSIMFVDTGSASIDTLTSVLTASSTTNGEGFRFGRVWIVSHTWDQHTRNTQPSLTIKAIPDASGNLYSRV